MRLFAVALVAVLLGNPGFVRADTPPSRVHATITHVDGGTFEATTQGGAAITVVLSDTTRVAAVSAANFSDIKPDSYVGCGALTQPDGKMAALEVTIFPPSMRGTGDGFRPWDAGPRSTMTNGAVGSVTGTGTRSLVIAYKGGQKTIDVPPDTPIVTLAVGTRALLTPGAHVTIFGTKAADGTVAARYLAVGLNGLVPPT